MDFTKPWQKIDAGETIIGPNSPSSLSAVTIPRADIDKVSRKEGEILIWGNAEYSDIFDPQVTHPMKFCYFLNTTTNTTNGKLGIVPSPYQNDCNISK